MFLFRNCTEGGGPKGKLGAEVYLEKGRSIYCSRDYLHRTLLVAPAAQVVVEISTELVADDVECERVDGRVDERQAEADRLEDVPVFVEAHVAVVPDEQPGVPRQPAGGEDDHEDQHDVGHLHSHIFRSRRRPSDAMAKCFQRCARQRM